MQVFYIQKQYAHSKKATFLAGVGSVLVFPGLVGFVYGFVSYASTNYKDEMMMVIIACLIAILVGLVFFHVAEKIGKKAEEEFRKKETASRTKQVDTLLNRNP